MICHLCKKKITDVSYTERIDRHRRLFCHDQCLVDATEGAEKPGTTETRPPHSKPPDNICLRQILSKKPKG